ncbi:MAG: hypothetical protein V4736_03550 [Bdellovibrionota bacterium]
MAVSVGLKCAGLVTLLSLTACKFEKVVESKQLIKYQSENKNAPHLGQVRFIMDGMGSLSLSGLFAQNLIPTKVYGTAFLTMGEGGVEKNKGKDFHRLMGNYGFMQPNTIQNWRDDWAPQPKLDAPLGFIAGDLEGNILGRTLKLNISNVTCAACHSGMAYDSKGNPNGNAWIGSPNTSLNLDGFLNRVFKGLKKGMENEEAFLAAILKAYPETDPKEYKTIKNDIIPQVRKTLKKMVGMEQAFNFNNGGPGITNGVGAFKRDANLSDRNHFDANEVGFVAIPDISLKGFRSSLTIDGGYGVPGKPRFEAIDEVRALDPEHISDLANLAAFFTFSAMGNSLKNIEPHIPRVQEVFQFLKYHRAQPFPAEVDLAKANRGSEVYAQSCSKCHGTYTTGSNDPRLLSFPNRLVEQQYMGTDPKRWELVTPNIRAYAESNVMKKYVDAGVQSGGYTAPLLAGVWSSAPYFHNGSVPTLWHVLHPESRPEIFELGGHAIDLEKVGIRGVQAGKEYVYPSDYKSWSNSSKYDTKEPGRSNKGHEKQFQNLTEEQKSALIEYLKLL